jgi:hypothetical protein
VNNLADNWKETFVIRGTNAAAIAALGIPLIIEDRANAEKHGNLPHNTFVITNTSTNCTLYLFLDNWSDLTKPDYVLFPAQQINVPIEDGQHFTHLAIYNTHAVTDVAINELKYKISTLKKFN